MERARAKLREGDVEISLRGYSHVFVHSSDAGSSSASEQELLEESEGVNAWQEVFDRPDLRKLAEAYAKGAGGLNARAGLGDHRPWDGHSFKKPAPRVPWLAAMGQLASGVVDAVIEAAPEPEEAAAESHASSPALELATPSQSPAQTDIAAHASAQGAAPSPAPSANLGAALSELVASKYAGGSQSDAERDGWAQEVTKKLKAALNSYGLQAAILGTRLTPNGCLVRLAGSDRLARRGHREQAHAAPDHSRDQPRHCPA
jgi:S-DNA-T family DNA segregation ATPase FtsK/SpoIIIE